jgi:hypothetical protein
MRELSDKSSLAEAHPSQWAPFAVGGEGAASRFTFIPNVGLWHEAAVFGAAAIPSATEGAAGEFA